MVMLWWWCCTSLHQARIHSPPPPQHYHPLPSHITTTTPHSSPSPLHILPSQSHEHHPDRFPAPPTTATTTLWESGRSPEIMGIKRLLVATGNLCNRRYHQRIERRCCNDIADADPIQALCGGVARNNARRPVYPKRWACLGQPLSRAIATYPPPVRRLLSTPRAFGRA